MHAVSMPAKSPSAGVVGALVAVIRQAKALALVQRQTASQVPVQDQRDQVGARPGFILGQFVHLGEYRARIVMVFIVKVSRK